MSEIVLNQPVFLSHGDIGRDHNPYSGFEPAVLEQALEKRAERPHRHGVYEAAELMLTEAAVEVVHIDVSREPYEKWEGRGLRFELGNALGFNDHCGGSESKFKILLNRYAEGSRPYSYVLYSPPDEKGDLTNDVFHRADFTFPTRPPMDRRPTMEDLPNNLKTLNAAAYIKTPRSYHRFFILGDTSTPQDLSTAFEEAGFGFVDEPYDNNVYGELSGAERRARDRLDYTELHAWPDQQFASQIEQLRTAEAKATAS